MNVRFQYVMIRGLILGLGLEIRQNAVHRMRLESSPSTRGASIDDDQSFSCSLYVIHSHIHSLQFLQRMVGAR
jgi:hypothetical protein